MKDVKLSPTLMAALAIFSAGLAGGWLLNPAARHESHEIVAAVDSAEPASPAAEQPAPAVASEAQPPDFAERLQRALAISRHLKRERAIAGLVDSLDASQIPEALAAAAKLPPTKGEEIRAELLNRWGALDHESALKYALASGERYDLRACPVLFGWAEADEAAVEGWATRQEGALQNAAWWALTEAVAEVDPEHALVLFAKVKDPYIETFAEKIFGKWAQTAPAAAAARLERMPDGYLRAAGLDIVAGKWAEVDLPAALAWAEALPDDATRRNIDVMHMESVPLVKVLAVWFDRDPGAAAAWLKRMPDKDRQVDVCESVIASVTRSDAERAAQLLPSLLPVGAVQDRVWTDLVDSWSEINPSSALAWINAQADPRLRKLCADAFVKSPYRWQEYNFPADAETASTLANLTADESEMDKRECTRSMLTAWAFNDPKAAAEWVAKRPPNADEWNSLISAWMQPDPSGAMTWVNRLPDGTEKQKLLVKFATDLNLQSLGNPEILATWISQITDAGARQTAYEKFANRWLDWDYVAAISWLPAAPLPDEVKQKLLQHYAR